MLRLAIYKFLDTKHGQIQLMKVATTINDTGYLLSFYAQEPSFHNYLPTIRRMIDSFRVINITNEERFDLGLRIKYPSDWTLQGPKVFLGVDNQDWNMLNLTDDRNKTALKLSISPQYDNAAEAEKVFNQIVKLASTLPNFPNVRLNSTDLRNHEAGRSSYFVNYSYGDPDYGKVITIQNITRSNDRVYWSEYSTIKEDYLKNFDLIRQVLSSLETFKIFRYENPFLGIISYYPSDWKHSDNSFYSPSYYGGFDSGKLEYYSQTDREPPYCDLTDLTSPTNTSKISKLSLNTTLGAKIDVKKIVSRENEVYEGYYSNETRQRQQMIICYNIHGKSYGANYTQTVYPGDVSYLSTAERIINSSRLIDINSSRASNKVYYKNSSDFAFSYPPGWLLMESKYAVSLNQNDSSLLIGPVIRNNTEIDQLATTDIDILVKTPSEYKFINSTIVKSNNISGYQITFQYNGTKYFIYIFTIE